MWPLQEAKVVTRNARNIMNYPARQAVLREQEISLSLPQHKLLESGKTRFLTGGDAAVRMLEVLPAVISSLPILIKRAADAKVCVFGCTLFLFIYMCFNLFVFLFLQNRVSLQNLLGWVSKKSYLISLAVEAMCLGRVNIMNRLNQSRKLNFHSYSEDLEKTLTDLVKMRDADAVSHWLQYRVSLHSTGLHKYFQLEPPDLAVCKARTVAFVNALVKALLEKMPSLTQIAAFDVFGPAQTEEGYMADPGYGEADVEVLYKTFLQVFCVLIIVSFITHMFSCSPFFIFCFSFCSCFLFSHSPTSCASEEESAAAAHPFAPGVGHVEK
jgi:hypothetical protein